MWTPAFDRFVEPARAKPQIWRILISVIVIAACWIATTITVLAGSYLVSGGGDLTVWSEALQNGTSPVLTIALLFTFIGLFVGTIFAGWIHGRKFRTLIGSAQLLPFLVGTGAILLTTAISLLIPTDLGLTRNIDMRTFLTLLPVALIGLLLQTGAEELAFRGYLQTQLAARFRSPLVWLVLPSVVFGLLHLNPAEYGPNTPYIVLATTVVGLLAADLTRVTGGLGAAWGLHFANNCMALLIVGSGGPLGGIALYHIDTSPRDPSLGPLILLDVIFLLLAWGLIRLWWHRRRAA